MRKLIEDEMEDNYMFDTYELAKKAYKQCEQEIKKMSKKHFAMSYMRDGIAVLLNNLYGCRSIGRGKYVKKTSATAEQLIKWAKSDKATAKQKMNTAKWLMAMADMKREQFGDGAQIMIKQKDGRTVFESEMTPSELIAAAKEIMRTLKEAANQ